MANSVKLYGDSRSEIAHGVGTGAGNIAARLAVYFKHVVVSEINQEVLDAATSVVPAELLKKITFLHCPAEVLAQNISAQSGGQGATNLITVSEFMPLLDAPVALKSFNELFRPFVTLAIYLYGPAVFADGRASECNASHDKVATRICTFNQPMKGTPGFPVHVVQRH